MNDIPVHNSELLLNDEILIGWWPNIWQRLDIVGLETIHSYLFLTRIVHSHILHINGNWSTSCFPEQRGCESMVKVAMSYHYQLDFYSECLKHFQNILAISSRIHQDTNSGVIISDNS